MKDSCNKYLQKQGKAYPRTCEECKLGPCKHIPPGKPLKDMVLDQYNGLKNMGLLFDFYPEATGDYGVDIGYKTEDYIALLDRAVELMSGVRYLPDKKILVDKLLGDIQKIKKL